MSDEATFDEARFADLLKIARRPSARFAGEGFDVSNPTWESIRVLVVGAGGLGCELLHGLALSGFVDMEVIDMDTIDLSNLNRQFLFRHADIGKPKADVAAAAVMKRCPWVTVKPHFDRVERKGDDFYKSFHLILLGLDSISARQWMNAKVASIGTWEPREDGTMTLAEAIPLVDGGTEGYKGSVRCIIFGQTACVECSMYLYPPMRGVPMCTLETIPRSPEHCVLYVSQKVWEDLNPFGEGVALDGDNAEHVAWVTRRAVERQLHFNILGHIDNAFTLGVVKNVVPAVGFTNALIAGKMVNEALKLVVGFAKRIDCFGQYDGAAPGVTSYAQFLAPDPLCPVCSMTTASASFQMTPQDYIHKVLASHSMAEVWGLKKRTSPEVVPEEGSKTSQLPFVDISLVAEGIGSGINRNLYLQFNTNNPLKSIYGDVKGGSTIGEILRASLGLSGDDLAAVGRKGIIIRSLSNNVDIRCFTKFS